MISSITEFLQKSDLEILDTIPLVLLDHDLVLLRDRLAKHTRKFFSHNQKIIVEHVDTEYYYHNHPLGFTMHNLFGIWRDLDLPLSIMVLLHNHQGLERGVSQIISDPKDAPTLINIIVNSCSIQHLVSYVDSPCPEKQIDYTAVCLMSLARSHRIALMQYLIKNKLLDQIRTNFAVGDQNYQGVSPSTVTAPVCIHTHLYHTVYSNPHRCKEDLFTCSRHPEILELLPISTSRWQDPVLLGDFNNFYHRFFLDVVTESQFDSPCVFISEKTLRPLLMQTPFVLFGPAGSLKHLHDHGFLTFGEFWSENYDQESDPQLRFLACCRILSELASLPLKSLRKLHADMLPTLMHNRKILQRYIKDQYQPLMKKITTND